MAFYSEFSTKSSARTRSLKVLTILPKRTEIINMTLVIWTIWLILFEFTTTWLALILISYKNVMSSFRHEMQNFYYLFPSDKTIFFPVTLYFLCKRKYVYFLFHHKLISIHLYHSMTFYSYWVFQKNCAFSQPTVSHLSPAYPQSSWRNASQ